MKIYLDQLDRQLAGKLAPVFLLSGDEPLQMLEAADAIRQAGKAAGFTHREIFTVDTGFDWGSLWEACHSYSLFGEARIIDLRLSGKPDKTGAEALLNVTGQLPDDAILLISIPKLTKTELNAKWIVAVEKIGLLVQIYPPEGDKLLRWLDRRLNSKGLLADQSGLRILATLVEGNLLAAAQEIEKLHILFGSGQLSGRNIQDSVADSARYDVFDLAEQVLKGDSGKSYRVLMCLKGEGIAAPVVLWAITRELRLINSIRTEIASGLSAEAVYSKFRLWDSRKALVGLALQRLNQTAIQQGFILAGKADQVIKGVLPGDAWDALLTLCMWLTNPSQTGNHSSQHRH